MADFTAVRIDDIEAIAFGTFRRARAALGVTSFGLQVLDLPPDLTAYPEHDHAAEGQEEVFAVLRGGGELEIDGERVALDPETLVRVGPAARRKVWPGSEGVRLLVLGGVPGGAYEPEPLTELGGPDPFAAGTGAG